MKPPVQIYSIESHYATALYSAVSKQNKLEQVEQELLRVAQILKEPQMAASIIPMESVLLSEKPKWHDHKK